MIRIVADQAGLRVALVEQGRVLLFDLPSLAPTAELGIAGDLADHDVRFVGEHGRLAVLSRAEGRAIMHVVDPAGPTKLGEVQFRTLARLVATAGVYALTVAGNVAAVTDISQPVLVAIPLPTRGVITAAAAIGPTRFAVAIGGAIEEWDAATRTPGRRLRVERPLDPLALGGSAQRIFVVSRDTPDIIDIITMGTRSTRKIQLPEPILTMVADPRGDVVAFIGATTQHAYLLDLLRGSPVRLERGEIEDLAWIGDGHALAIKPVGGSLEIVTVATTTEPLRRPMPGVPVAEPALAAAALAQTQHERDAEADGVDEGAGPAEPLPDPADPAPGPTADGPGAPEKWSREEISHRLAAWRNRFGGDGRGPMPTEAGLGDPDRDEPDLDEPDLDGAARLVHPFVSAAALAQGRPTDPAAPLGLTTDLGSAPVTGMGAVAAAHAAVSGHAGGWRGELATWARSVDAGSVRTAPLESRPSLDVVITRLGLSADVAIGVALLYGAHLAGLRGIAPLELASACGWHWDEALGTGQLATLGIACWTSSRVRLTEETLAAIDHRPPRFGTRVGIHDASGEVAASSEAVALLVPSAVPLDAVGVWAARALGALLVPNARGEQAPIRFILEARMRGLAPLVPWERFAPTLTDPPHPSAIVVAQAATAARLDLPVVATWSDVLDRFDDAADA